MPQISFSESTKDRGIGARFFRAAVLTVGVALVFVMGSAVPTSAVGGHNSSPSASDVDVAGKPQLTLLAAGASGVHVVNTGDTSVVGITVLPASCERNWLARLEPGTHTRLSCTVTGPLRVVGTSVLGEVSADLAKVPTAKSGLVVAHTLTSRTYGEGDDVHLTMTVTNGDAKPMTNVTIHFAPIEGCADVTIESLPAGETRRAECRVVAPRDDISTIVVGRATNAAGESVGSVSNPVLLDIVHPRLVVTIAPSEKRPAYGASITWSLVVANVGDTDLANIKITTTIPECAPGETPYLPIAAPSIQLTCGQIITGHSLGIAAVEADAGLSYPISAAAWETASPR